MPILREQSNRENLNHCINPIQEIATPFLAFGESMARNDKSNIT